MAALITWVIASLVAPLFYVTIRREEEGWLEGGMDTQDLVFLLVFLPGTIFYAIMAYFTFGDDDGNY